MLIDRIGDYGTNGFESAHIFGLRGANCIGYIIQPDGGKIAAVWHSKERTIKARTMPATRQIIHTGKNEPMIPTDGARLQPEHRRQTPMQLIRNGNLLITFDRPWFVSWLRAKALSTGCR
jgi:hypothetical protein